MAVIRVERNENYTHMSNYHLRDKSLSLRAIGLLSKMLSLPPEWDYTVSGLAAICKEGRDAVRATLMELEAAGYMVRQQTHTEAGTFGKNDYTVYEQPMALPLTEKPSTVEPPTAKPTTEPPLTENSAQINKDLIKDLPNNPPIPPKGGRRVKSVPKYEPEIFERLWDKYPCGKDRAGAVTEWDKLKPDRKLMMTMSAALDRQIASTERQRGIGIPYLCRLLSKRRWEDDLSKSGAAQEASATGEDGEMEVQVWS